jgi:SAM-dependent methyltransferase
MADMRPGADDVEAGQRVYTPLTLRVYDLFVLGFSNRFVWRCPSSKLLERYESHVGARHLDVGVGTGWFLDHCKWPVETPQITLLDLNENSLSAASDRIRRYAPKTIQANVLDPVDLGDARFDSIGVNYLFHCLPGGLELKAATVVSNLRPYLASGGVVFGSTILGRGVAHNLLGRRLMRLYNRKGIFSNVEDDERGLDQGLASELTDVVIDVVGAVALFVASSSERRGPAEAGPRGEDP